MLHLKNENKRKVKNLRYKKVTQTNLRNQLQ